MICPECGSKVATKRNRCERCGTDLTTFKKVTMLSNIYYNEGLEKTKVRDLSGAILVLKKSLEMNKRNTNARNLLGLVYYEVGETVSALSEWVISKHFQAEDNDADEYMEALQSNPTKLESLNQTIKKYNSALQSAKQGSDDLAIIQLKKVTSLNPHFVKALQLLALLYMKNGENDKALKALLKASKIDVSNTTTLRYLHELDEKTDIVQDSMRSGKKEIRKVVQTQEQTVFPTSSYKEDKPNVWAFVNLIIGVAIGIGVLFFLVVPTVKKNALEEAKKIEIEYSESLSKQTSNLSSLEKENKNLQNDVKRLQKQVDEFQTNEVDGAIYDKLFAGIELYLTELAKGNVNDIDYVAIADSISKIKPEQLDIAAAKDVYDQIKNASFIQASEILYDEGHDEYSARKYDKALELLEKSFAYNPDNVDAIYFIGRSYHQMGDLDKAATYYTKITEEFPDNSRANEAEGKLREIGQ
jgi:tetratricopeptide (TPR) repeat protein